MQLFTDTPDLPICARLVWMLPRAREDYSPRLRDLFARTLATARASADPHIRQWLAAVDAAEPPPTPWRRNEPT